MEAVAVIWVGTGLILWVAYRLIHGDVSSDIHAPPQKTLLGAMMWPFYLVVFLYKSAAALLGFRPKTDDK